jgi:hypothetical protein
MMRARVVRTVRWSASASRASRAARTLGDVDVAAREAVEGGQARPHVHAVLRRSAPLQLQL